jgi:hypothetical protein
VTQQLVLFDYGTLDSETRIVVQQRTGEIKDLVRTTAENIMQIGEKLLEVQVKLGSGQFDAWLESEFSWSRRTAYNFISVHKQFQGRANFAQMEIATSALYLLAAPSTPAGAVDEALERADKGERISHGMAKEIVAEHKAEEQARTPQAVGLDFSDPAGDDPPGTDLDFTAVTEDEAPDVNLDFAVGDTPGTNGHTVAPKPEDNEPVTAAAVALKAAIGSNGHSVEPRPGWGRPVREMKSKPKPAPGPAPKVAPKPALPPEPKISLDFSTPAAVDPVPVPDIVLTVRMKRKAIGDEPHAIEIDINDEDGPLKGQMPLLFSGAYDQLTDLVIQATEEYLANLHIEEITDER